MNYKRNNNCHINFIIRTPVHNEQENQRNINKSANAYSLNYIDLKNLAKTHTRLDMNFMCALVQQLNRKEALLPHLCFYANKSIHISGDQLRYVKYGYVKGVRDYQISVVDNCDYLQSLLKCAENGSNLNDLVACLTNDAISEKEATGFVKELIDTQVLVSELEPSITGDEFIYRVLTTLRRINNTDHDIKAIVTLLENTQDEITKINLNGISSVDRSEWGYN